MHDLVGIHVQPTVPHQWLGPWLSTTYEAPTVKIHLYSTGCLINGENNCAVACKQPKSVWEDVQTLQNCLAYPIISTLLDGGGLDDAGITIAKDFGILPGQEKQISTVLDSMNDCAIEYCDSLSKDELGQDWCKLLPYSPPAGDFTPTDYVYASYYDIYYNFTIPLCANSEETANPDIAGIGLYASYLMQLGIMLAAWLYSSGLTSWARVGAYAISWPSGACTAKERSRVVQQRLDSTDQHAVLISGLVEFQKAQAYFGITMQGAAILALSGDGSVFDAITYKRIGLTVAVLGDVAATGIVCITFGLYMLQKAKKTSWYVTALSLLATTLSTTTWTRTRTPLGNLLPRGETDVKLPSCGGFVTPVKFCTAATTIDFNSKFEAPIITCCTIMLLLLVAMQGHKFFLKCYQRASSMLPEIPGLYLLRIERRRLDNFRNLESSETGINVFRAAAETILATAACIMVVWLGEPTRLGIACYYLASTPGGQWTFGQLIAITIWAPSIIEYIHSAIYGLEEAQEHRYAHPFKLVKDDRRIDIPAIQRAGTFYTRLDSHSDLELPLAHSHSPRMSFQDVR